MSTKCGRSSTQTIGGCWPVVRIEPSRLANRIQSNFVSCPSRGMTSLLLQKPLDGETADFVETIRNSSDALLSVINDILDFSKIESGRFDVEDQALDLVKCAEESVDLLSVRAAEKRIELAVEID